MGFALNLSFLRQSNSVTGFIGTPLTLFADLRIFTTQLDMDILRSRITDE